MVFVFVVLWTLAAILLITNPKYEAARWIALTLFVAGGGALSLTITENVLPYLRHFQIGANALELILFNIHLAGSFLNLAGTPYCFLMFAICYSELFRERIKKVIAYLLFLPVPVMFWITPFAPDIRPDYRMYFVWCVPYFIIGTFLLLYSTRIEKNGWFRRDRMRTNMLVIPPVVFQATALYTTEAFFPGWPEIWRYAPVVIGVMFFAFLLLSKHGILGVRFRFEKNSLHHALRATTSGTSIINHAIKNEMGKIKIMADLIQSAAAANHQMEIQQYGRAILDSSEHLLTLVSRIQSQLRDDEVKKRWCNLEDIIQMSLSQIRPYLEQKQFQVIVDSTGNTSVFCDEVLIREVLKNLFTNAMEATEERGRLYLSLYETQKHVIVEIMDNGVGISPEDLPHVMEPFYSTKKESGNFGLGLSFCYNVMQKHQGFIEVESVLNEGTTVTLFFPKQKKFRMLEEVSGGGQNQDLARGG